MGIKYCRQWLVTVSLLAGMLGWTVPALAAPTTPISPPFGLNWLQSSSEIERLLNGAKATISDRREIDGREAWTVNGLLQANLKRAVFYFNGEGLVEVELQYENSDWTSMKYSDFMGQVRRKIEQRFGVGKLIARQKSAQEGVMQTVVGYKWNQNNTSIQLIYYAAENSAYQYRSVSVHYKLIAGY